MERAEMKRQVQTQDHEIGELKRYVGQLTLENDTLKANLESLQVGNNDDVTMKWTKVKSKETERDTNIITEEPIPDPVSPTLPKATIAPTPEEKKT